MSGRWSEISIAGHPCDLYEPEQPNPHGFVLIYLHGVHQQRLVDKQPFVDAFAAHRLPVVAPLTKRSWWTDKICPEFSSRLTAERHLLDNVLPFVAERFESQPPRLGLFGTSMGGQGALRFSYKYPRLFPVVAALSPAIDYQIRFYDEHDTISEMYPDPESVRQDTATLHVHPLNWPKHQFFCCDPADERWWESADRLRMKLYSLGVPHTCDLESSGGGHGFDYYNRMARQAVGFLAERLLLEKNSL
ncbi:MAG: esterase [Planctomycetes bacterium]|nr:esterase [Planctomycetota bacterium]